MSFRTINRQVLNALINKYGANSPQFRTLDRYLECQRIFMEKICNGADEKEAWKSAAKHWNDWAKSIVNRQDDLKNQNVWKVERGGDRWLGITEQSKNWINDALVDFSELVLVEIDVECNGQSQEFSGRYSGKQELEDQSLENIVKCAKLSFDGFMFPYNAVFRNTTFKGDVSFQNAIFRASAIFAGSTIEGNISLDDVSISGDLNFNNSSIDGNFHMIFKNIDGGIDFSGAKFSKGVDLNGGEVENSSSFEKAEFGGDVNFNVRFNSSVNFRETKFKGSSSLSGLHFSGSVDFTKSEFEKDCNFKDSRFISGVIFSHSIFHGISNFNGVRFCIKAGAASFDNTVFMGMTYFKEAKFKRSVKFKYSVFEKPVEFIEAEFEAEADFTCIRCERSFSLHHAKFKQVPDFTQAAFQATPVLDDIDVDDPCKARRCLFVRCLEDPENDGQSISRRLRYLAKMAREGHDWLNQMRFFAYEVRARRFSLDKPFGKNAGRFYLGVLYDVLSNFGRSFARPLTAWGVLTLFYAWLYYANAVDGPEAAWGWLDPLYLAFRHGLVIGSLIRTGHLERVISALFGDYGSGIAFLMLSQSLLSLPLVFFFFLALRNQFKLLK